MRINNDFIIIGVDAGYGNMKTANTIFPTGLAAMDTKRAARAWKRGNTMSLRGA